MYKRSLLIAVLVFSTSVAAGGICVNWSEPVIAGTLDIAKTPEASGIAVSHAYSRLYHLNDGSEPAFYVTDLSGGAMRKVSVTGFQPIDMEDMALGRCGERDCLYLADTGDNAVWRESVQIAIVEELKRFSDSVTPLRVVNVRYPGEPYDAEAVALHSSGDLFVVTKMRVGREGPARLFKLSATQLAAGGEQTLAALGEIPVPALTNIGSSRRRTVTSMDITQDGDRFILLTYDSAIEIALDANDPLPKTDEWIEGRTHRALPISQLIQAEAVAYAPDGRSIFYTTESVRGSAVPVMRQACK